MTSDVIAWATLGGILVTAVGTLALAVSTRRLAASTERQAKSTSDSVDLQRRELLAVEKQLELTQEQAQATRDQLSLATKQFEVQQSAYEQARLAARPLLEVNALPVTPGLFNAQLIWVQGTEPAFHVHIWLKLSSGICYMHPLGTQPVGAGKPQQPIKTDAAATDMPWPFPETDDEEPLGSDDYYVGLRWQSADQWLGRYLIRSGTIDSPGAMHGKERRYRVLVPSCIDPPSERPDQHSANT